MHDGQEQEEPKDESENLIPVETINVEEPTFEIQENDYAAASASAPSAKLPSSSKSQIFQEVAAECLTCENLIHCDSRNRLTAQPEEQIRDGVSRCLDKCREIQKIKTN